VRVNVGILLLLSLCSLIAADVNMHFEQDGLSIERQLSVQHIGAIDTSSGVARTRYSSTITLIITNLGPVDRQNIALSEDLSYLPSYIRLSYSEKPSSDGRTARWNLSHLSAGRSVSYSIVLPALVSDASVLSARAPQVSSDKPPAQLTAPNLVDLGQNVVILLRSASGAPLSGAHIDAIGPDSHPIALVTDSSGRAAFIASQAGFYTYLVNDYRVGFKPTTEARPAPVPVPPTTGAVVALPSNTTATTPPPFALELSGFLPLAGALLVVGIVAFGLYVYFNRPVEDDSPLPPAPATRPTDFAEPRNENNESSSEQVRSFSAGSQSGPSDLRSSKTSSYVPPTSDAASSKTPVSPAQDSGDVREQTRSLIANRRGQADTSSSVRSSPSDFAPSPSSVDWDSKPPVGEETTIVETDSDSKEPDEYSSASDSSHASDSLAQSGFSPAQDSSSPSPRPIPSWMSGTVADGEKSEVDDEAISKTISELEALREELKARSRSREERNRREAGLAGVSLGQEESESDSDYAAPDSSQEDKVLPPEEEAAVDAILLAEPSLGEETAELPPLAPEEEAELEQEVASINTEIKESDDESDEQSLFTPTQIAPEHPLEEVPAGRSAASRLRKKESKSPPISRGFAKPSKQTWSVVKSAPIAQRAKRVTVKQRKTGKTTKPTPKKGGKR